MNEHTPNTNHRLLDPTAETSGTTRTRIEPLSGLGNAVIGLVSISKERSNEFMDTVELRLRGRGLSVMRFEKPTHTKPAPEPLVQEVVEHCDAIVQALAD